MEWRTVLTHTDKNVFVITLDDERRRNALFADTCRDLIAAIDTAESDESVRVLVIIGEGSAFCAGADLQDLLAAADGDTANVDLVYDAFGRVADSALVTVAGINGPAVGAGLNLALACDLRIATSHASFESRFLDLGIHPGGGHTWMLERALGSTVAVEMLLFGRRLDAQRAHQLGFVSEVCAPQTLRATAMSWAHRAGRYPRAVVGPTKDSLRVVHGWESRGAALAHETARQRESLATDHAKSRLDAVQAAISTTAPAGLKLNGAS